MARTATLFSRVFTPMLSEVCRNSTRIVTQAAGAVNASELRNGNPTTQRREGIPGCHKIQGREQFACSIHRMAWDGADWGVSNRSERICPARRTVQHGLAPTQVREDLLGGHSIAGTELILQRALLHGTIDLPQIVDASHSLVLR